MVVFLRREEEEEDLITSGNRRGQHNSLSLEEGEEEELIQNQSLFRILKREEEGGEHVPSASPQLIPNADFRGADSTAPLVGWSLPA